MAGKNDFAIYARVQLDVADIQKQLNQVSSGAKIKIDTSGLDEASKGLDKVSKSASDAGLTFQQANMIMNEAIDIISSMTSEVFELDSALTEFKKISNLRGSGLEDYVDELKDLGATVARTGKPLCLSLSVSDGKHTLRCPQNPVKPKAYRLQHKDEISLSAIAGNY